MKFLVIFLFVLTSQVVHSEKAAPIVQWRGALKKMMHEGDISATIALDSLSKIPHLYALGAVENLKGEIIILNSKPFISFVQNDSLRIDTTFLRKATLLVFAQVDDWEAAPVPDSVETYEQFENFLSEAAKRNGINTDEPFPFLIKGQVASANWHIIDWPDGDTVHTHEKHQQSGLKGTIENREATILGFYSSKHRAIFTHHSTNMHLHILSKDQKLTGHLDIFTLSNGATLLLAR